MKIRNNTNRKLDFYFWDTGAEDPAIMFTLKAGGEKDITDFNFDFMSVQEN